jgi:hypothetical protein
MCSTQLLLTLFFTLATKSLGEYGETSQACTKLDSELPGRVYYPESAAFEQSVASYAYAETRLRPNCIFGPQRVEDVTKAIRILTKYPSVEFAIRSGGHNSNKGMKHARSLSKVANIKEGSRILTVVSRLISLHSTT